MKKISSSDLSGNTKKEKWSYCSVNFAVWFIITSFTVWTFTFYFVAIGLPVYYIMMAFIIWAIWNAINDPLVGHISDRTQTRWGRRRPFIMLGIIPLALVYIFLWVPPTETHLITFAYLLVLLFLFDTFYSMIAIPADSLFPELYITYEERTEVNSMRQIMGIIGILMAFIIPGIFIEELTNKEGYLINGIITAIIVVVAILIMLKWGPKEKKEFKLDHIQNMTFFQGIKHTFKNKAFVLFFIMFFLHEYFLQVLAVTTPLFLTHVFGVQDTLLISLFFMIYFLAALLSMVLWRKIDIKLGTKKTFRIALIYYFLCSLPYLFNTSIELALINSIFTGAGFGGMLYCIWILIADVIDRDELETGIRREGIYYGIASFFIRFAIIASIVTVALVYTSTGWESYTPNPGADVIWGNRLLYVVFPGIALLLTLVCLHFYPLSKEIVDEMKSKMSELHKQKRERI